MNHLNIRTINKFLKVFQSNNVMVNIAANLNKTMEAMQGPAMRANADAAVQAKYVLLILLCIFMVGAIRKEVLLVQCIQPFRHSVNLIKY